MIPRPIVIVKPMTTVGAVKLTGTVVIAGRLVCGNDRFAPHLLQYFSSTVISLPQVGQYIDTSKQSTVLRSKEFEKFRIPFYEEFVELQRTVANPTFQDVTLPSITINRTIRNS